MDKVKVAFRGHTAKRGLFSWLMAALNIITTTHPKHDFSQDSPKNTEKQSLITVFRKYFIDKRDILR